MPRSHKSPPHERGAIVADRKIIDRRAERPRRFGHAQVNMTAVIAYTDGGCRGNPGGIGGWAFLLFVPETGSALECAGGERSTTNNRMEMTAAIQALSAIRRRNAEI